MRIFLVSIIKICTNLKYLYLFFWHDELTIDKRDIFYICTYINGTSHPGQVYFNTEPVRFR